MSKKIRLDVDYIRPNSTLIYPIYSEKGDKILSERVILSMNILKEIKRKYGSHVYYNDTADKSIIPAYRMNIALNRSREVMREVEATSRISKASFRETEKMVEEIVSDLNSSEIQAISLLKELKNIDEYLFNHSVNVGILTGSFARLMDFSPEETRDLVLGAFFLDIGHMMLDRQLASHSGRYSVTEKQKMKRHPQLGYEILKGIPGVSPAVLQSVLFHHERYNSEGYYQMPYENLPLPPKIVGACDMYDALTSVRPYRAAFSPASALKILLNSINIHFDYRLVHSFINRLGPFLNNTQSFYTANDVCELNSRELALVMDIETEDFLRPRVMVFCRFEKHEGRLAVRFHDNPVEVDLVQDGERYITRILDDKRQIEMIREKLRSRGLLQ